MENKAPGTVARETGYAEAGSVRDTENMFMPRTKTAKINIQRESIRLSRRLVIWFGLGTLLFVILPTHLGPIFVEYMAGQEWLKRANKTIWQRRNEIRYDMFYTQRKNSWLQWLGLKQYDISGDENKVEIQKYR